MEENFRFNLKNTYACLPKIFFTKQHPEHSPSPELIILNKKLAKELGLDESLLESKEGIDVLCGNAILKDSTPIAEAYAGHQFGYFTMLGDGRAVLLGEHKTKDGKLLDIQLKGSGETPYSRGGDGKASIGPMLREYIISEAMNALKIPTTRSLAVIMTGQEVFRDGWLDGAVLTRIASSHIRVGTFQFAANYGRIEDLKELADYTINRHYPEINDEKDKYLLFLRKVIDGQAKLISKWMQVGFIHGVMNTDNITISCETIDYGPCAFMDTYSPETVFSSIDTGGRYAYGNQPKMAAWDLARFAETLVPLIDDNHEKAVKLAQDEISNFAALYEKYYLAGMRSKLGLFNEKDDDEFLINKLLNLMGKYKADYTNTFVSLTTNTLVKNDLFNSEDFKEWHSLWKARLTEENKSEEEICSLMMNSNPAVIPRNHLVEEALTAAIKGDYTVMNLLLKYITKPYDYVDVLEYYTKEPKPSAYKYKTYCGT